jgi:hypothetical protein
MLLVPQREPALGPYALSRCAREDCGAARPRDIDLLSQGKHATKSRDRLLDTPRGSQGALESDLVVKQGSTRSMSLLFQASK